jgi:N6-adenosine-specific RNA methylase IME4
MSIRTAERLIRAELRKKFGPRTTRTFVWIKLRRGLEPDHWPLERGDLHTSFGLTTRKGAEDVLLGRGGNCRRNARDIREVIVAPVRERKPDEFYTRIEHDCDGPYADIFAREKRDGWDCWGDQVDLYRRGQT